MASCPCVSNSAATISRVCRVDTFRRCTRPRICIEVSGFVNSNGAPSSKAPAHREPLSRKQVALLEGITSVPQVQRAVERIRPQLTPDIICNLLTKLQETVAKANASLDEYDGHLSPPLVSDSFAMGYFDHTFFSSAELNQLVLETAHSLAQEALQQIKSFSPGHVIAALSILSHLNYANRRVISSLWTALPTSSLRHLTADQLTEVLSTAAAMASLQPPPSSLIASTAAATSVLLPQLTTPQLCTILHAFSELRFKPDSAWLHAAAKQLASSTHHPPSTPHLLLSVASLTALGHTPDDSWFNAYWQHSLPQLRHTRTHDAVRVLNVLGRLSRRPPEAWCELLNAALLSDVRSLVPRQVTAILNAFSELGIKPSAQWMNSVLAHPGALLPGASLSDLCELLVSLSRLQFRTADDWLATFMSATYPLLPFMTPHHASALLSGLCKVGYSADSPWLQALLAVSQRKLVACSAPQLVSLINSLARLRVCPPRGWLEEYEKRSNAVLARLSSADLTTIIWAFEALGHRPQSSWLYSFVLAAYAQLNALDSVQLDAMFRSLGRLAPSDGWLDELVQICAVETAVLAQQQGAATASRRPQQPVSPQRRPKPAAGQGSGVNCGRYVTEDGEMEPCVCNERVPCPRLVAAVDAGISADEGDGGSESIGGRGGGPIGSAASSGKGSPVFLFGAPHSSAGGMGGTTYLFAGGGASGEAVAGVSSRQAEAALVVARALPES